MKEVKITKVQALSKAIEVMSAQEGCEEFVAKLEAMKAQLEKEAARDRKETPKAKAEREAKEAFAQQVLAFVKSKEGVGAKEVAAEFGVTFQKVSPALSKLVKAGLVKREEVKGKAVFTA